MCVLTLPKLLFQDILQVNCCLHLPKLLDFVHAAVNRLLWLLTEGTDFMHNGAETHNCHVGLEQFSLILLCRLWYCSSHLPILTMQPVDTVAIRAGRLVVQASMSKLLLPCVLCSPI